MPFHLAAYQLLTNAVANNVDTPALADPVMTINNGHFILRKPYGLIKAGAISLTLARARFDSPTMRFYGNPFIRPAILATLPPANPNEMQLFRRPIILPPGEEIAVQTTITAAGPEPTRAFIWLMSQYVPAPPGNVYVVRFTGSTAVGVAGWTLEPYVMDQAIPSGLYSMVFSELISTTGLVHRWIFDEQVERPGGWSCAAEDMRQNNENYEFPLGEYGKFINTSLPRLEVLCGAADAAFVGYMWLIPLGTGVQTLSPSGLPQVPTSGIVLPPGVGG